MTITSGSSKLASDFNSIVGSIGASAPYASSAAATGKVAALYGVGYGDRGYGQLSPVLTKKTVGNPNELLWLCSPSGDNANDGGWNAQFPIPNRTQKYRSTVWIRVLNQSGSVYHGLAAGETHNLVGAGGAMNDNPYWLAGGAGWLTPGQWYLSVGIVHEAGYTGGYSGVSGLYDIQGNKVMTYPEFRLSPTATVQLHRAYHYYDNDSTQRQWFARPRFEAAAGAEPSITTLLTSSFDALTMDTLVNPSTWYVTTVSGYIGVFSSNASAPGEDRIVQANTTGNIEGPTGHLVKGQDFVDIRTALSSMATYQGTSQASLPAASVFAAGQPVNAANEQALATFASTVDANRLLTNGGASLSSSPAQLTITRGTSWGSGNTNIVCEATVAFPTEDAARFFFNSGGKIDLVLAHPNTSTPQDTSWNGILSALGTISFGAHSTIRSGTGGAPNASMGYYEIANATYSNIFDGTNIGAGAYSNNDIYVEAIALGVGGINGANGSSIRFRVTLFEPHVNAFSDLVQGGTNAKFGFKKAAVQLTNIVTPTFTTTTNF